MEEQQHPVPQDITGFEFKLVGDMTLRQFGFLAGGVMLAVLFYFSGLPGFAKWPLVGFFVFAGVAFAFLPIEERPLDKWVSNFIRSVYAPTIFTWKKRKAVLDFMNIDLTRPEYKPREKLRALSREERKINKYLSNLPEKDDSELGKKEIEMLKGIDFSYGGQAEPVEIKREEPALQPRSFIPIRGDILMPEKKDEIKEDVPGFLEKDDEKEKRKEGIFRDGIEGKIDTLESKINELKESGRTNTGALWQLKELGLELQKAKAEKEKLKQELGDLKRKKEVMKGVTPTIDESIPEEVKTERVKFITAEMAQKRGIPVSPGKANIIGGIVKDKDGREIEGVVLVVKDKNEAPVRALKTNRVGQFMMATPLENGRYTIELEKEGCLFDIIEIELKGGVLPAVEITAK